MKGTATEKDRHVPSMATTLRARLACPGDRRFSPGRAHTSEPVPDNVQEVGTCTHMGDHAENPGSRLQPGLDPAVAAMQERTSGWEDAFSLFISL